MNRNIDLFCIYSLPRSGSTALLAQLEKSSELLCMPESYFPQAIEFLKPIERLSNGRVAQLYIDCCPAGAVLSFKEALACIELNDLEKTLVSLGLAVASKVGRDTKPIKAIIWKTTRLVSRSHAFSGTGGKFVVLRRNPLNVYESQFRVGFGIHNRNAFRFAVFRETYEEAFARLPKDRLFELDYEDTQVRIGELLSWLGVGDEVTVPLGSVLSMTHAKKEWHGGLMDSFHNSDKEKISRLTPLQGFKLRVALLSTRFFRPFTGRLRDYFDEKLFQKIDGSSGNGFEDVA